MNVAPTGGAGALAGAGAVEFLAGAGVAVCSGALQRITTQQRQATQTVVSGSSAADEGTECAAVVAACVHSRAAPSQSAGLVLPYSKGGGLLVFDAGAQAAQQVVSTMVVEQSACQSSPWR